MNRTVLLPATVLFLSLLSSAAAQRPEILIRTDLGVATNYSLENARTVGPSWSLGAGLGLGRLSVLGTIGFDQFMADRDLIAGKNQDIWTGESTKISSLGNYPMAILTLSGDARYRIRDSEEGGSFYVSGGAAFFRLVQDDIEITSEQGSRTMEGSKRNSFGLMLGGGFELPVFRHLLWLYGETRFGAGIAGDRSGFEPHYTSFRLGAEIRM